jgi:hypothetical protein
VMAVVLVMLCGHMLDKHAGVNQQSHHIYLTEMVVKYKF